MTLLRVNPGTGLKVPFYFALLFSLGLLVCACAQAPCQTAPETDPSCGPLSYYDFFAKSPPLGYCESQVFGAGTLIAEPVNAAFSATTFLLGILGLYRSRRTTMAFQFLYGLLAAYGLSAVAEHVSLNNGLYRIHDACGSFIQSFVIIMLAHSLYLYHVKKKTRFSGYDGYRALGVTMTLVFTIYPAIVHVAGESSADPWVAWLVFDLLWILIIAMLIMIWVRRDTWPGADKPEDRSAFNMVWWAVGTGVAAYAGWCIDKFLCTCETPWLAYFHFHGWWHLFMGLCFYYLISLNRYFSAHEYGFQATLQRLPAAGPIYVPFVEWKSRRK